MGPGHAATRERGSLTLFFVIFAVAAFALLSLVVDGGTAINAKERAANIAGQAARAAADQVDVAALRSTGKVQIDQSTACQQAAGIVATYQTASHTSARMAGPCAYGTDPATNQQTVTVGVRVTTAPVIPAFFSSFTMSASATAEEACGNAIQKENC